jgi:hypothetical protein
MVAAEPMYHGLPSATLAVGDAAPNALAGLVWDVAAYEPGFDAFGVRFYIGLQAPVITVVGTTQADQLGRGFTSMSFRVPPELAGHSIVSQWLVLDPAAASGLTASSAVRIDL